MSAPRIAVLQFPGVNCEAETVRALAAVGLVGEVFRWTRPADGLAAYDGYVLPGGWSYQDRVRAGAIAAKDPMLETLAAEAEAGKPVLGICNGAQVLVEAGLVPGGGHVELALARNRMPGRTGYYTRWVRCRVERSRCLFTSHLEPGTLLPLPIAHGEGRFTTAEPGRLEAWCEAGQVPLRYATADGAIATAFPDAPNGAEAAAAAGFFGGDVGFEDGGEDGGGDAGAIVGVGHRHKVLICFNRNVDRWLLLLPKPLQ